VSALPDWEGEIRRLHDFFAAYYRGDLPPSASATQFEPALAADFRLGTPDGATLDRATVIAHVRAGHGRGPFQIRIEASELVAAGGDIIVARYQEWQEQPEATKALQSMVAFRRDDDTPGGLRWLSVQETELPVRDGG
jgi:hypothetical protein